MTSRKETQQRFGISSTRTRAKILTQVVFLCFLGLFSSCNKDIEGMPSPSGLETEVGNPTDVTGMLVLGGQLENPYSVLNMERAMENLVSTNPLGPTIKDQINIRTTHQYIRFYPKDWDEHGVLSRDTNLILSTFPLDHEVLKEGHFYHDPTIPEDNPTYQYSVVKPGQILPDVEYEVLADLYIPEEDPELINMNGNASIDSYVDLLVTEALRMTDNLEEVNKIQHGRWTPAGNISIYDNSAAAWVPVEGLNVRAWRWFRILNGTTDSQGNFSCDGEFHYSARYYYYWQTYQYDIRNGLVFLACNWGPYQRGDWNEEIQENEEQQQFYGHIYRASYDYYFNDILDLQRPPMNIQGRPKFKMATYFDGNGTSFFFPFPGYVIPQIQILRNNRTGAVDIYGLTMHELAHAAHWEKDTTAMASLGWQAGELLLFQNECNASSNAIGARKVIESWATGASWALTKEKYPGNRGDEPRTDSLSICPYDDPEYYTAVAIDMIDDLTGTPLNHGAGAPIDSVQGYTIKQIEDALIGTTSWNGWKDNIKSLHTNPTESHLDSLFSFWGGI